MSRKIDMVFNSDKDNSKGYFQIASGYISETVVHFEKENVILVIHADGRVELFDMGDKLLAENSVPKSSGGREVYEEACCEVIDNTIVVKFPIYKWIDNYPNCDGEHDRWDTIKIGEHTVEFALTK